MSSYPLLLRDKLMTKLQALPFFTGKGFHFHTDRSVQIQPENVPFCGVYLIESVGLPDGDPNAGEVRFRTTARYGISVVVQDNDSARAQRTLDGGLQQIESLYADHEFYNWQNAGKDGEVAVQSFNRNNPTYSFGSIGADNSLPIVELRYDMTCDLGVITYPPTIPDELKQVHLETRYPLGEAGDVVQTIAAWDIFYGEEANSRWQPRGTLRADAEVV